MPFFLLNMTVDVVASGLERRAVGSFALVTTIQYSRNRTFFEEFQARKWKGGQLDYLHLLEVDACLRPPQNHGCALHLPCLM